MEGGFFSLMFRMKYIGRWGLMRLNRPENLSEHSLECVFLAHALSSLGNRMFGKQYDCERIALKAAYHDAPEILTGDLPTPVKYYSESTRDAYRVVEDDAIKHFIDLVPPEMREDYAGIFTYTEQEHRIIKAADKLCAYLKCLEETNAGNTEFLPARESTLNAIHALGCDEAEYFLTHYAPAFTKPLDELK